MVRPWVPMPAIESCWQLDPALVWCVVCVLGSANAQLVKHGDKACSSGRYFVPFWHWVIADYD